MRRSFIILAAGVGCAAANYFGNHGQHPIAIAILVATVGFIIYFLNPFQIRIGTLASQTFLDDKDRSHVRSGRHRSWRE